MPNPAAPSPARPSPSPGVIVTCGSPRRDGGHARRYLLLVLLPLVLGLAGLQWLAPSGLAITAPALPAPLASGLHAPLPLFLLQLLVVLALAKAAGVLLGHVGQPPVIGEMLAGIVLGPSLLGWAWPQAQAWLFPSHSLPTLSQIGQLGVLVFMLTAGAEFDLARLRGRRRLTLVLSHAGIALPMVLGILLARPLYAEYAPADAGFSQFALFLGVALSVTAFPVLLRIIEALRYQARPVAALAIASAAISDASAWALLGGVVTSVRAQGGWSLVVNLLIALLLCGVLLGPVQRRLSRLAIPLAQRSSAMIALILGALACALITEAIGLHLLFGAFLAGLAVSSNAPLRALVEERIQPFATVLLLPVFFASTGLGLRVNSLTGDEWALCAVLIAVATLGKVGATGLAARWSGVAPADCWRLGALMNTRGLMELIVLALGFELGLIDQRLYAVLVLVAIATTLMTTPMLKLIDRLDKRVASSAE